MVDNNEVGRAWAEGKVASGSNFSTNGKEIYSYALLIGKTVGGQKVAIDYTTAGGHKMSATTSKHVTIAKRNSHRVIAPPKQLTRN